MATVNDTRIRQILAALDEARTLSEERPEDRDYNLLRARAPIHQLRNQLLPTVGEPAMSEFPPLIYVDLIKDEPLNIEQYRTQYHYGYGAEQEKELRSAYNGRYLKKFQPWRVLIKSGDNQEPLFRSTESYFHEADARHAVDLAFGPGSNVYLRASEKGNELLRAAVPNAE